MDVALVLPNSCFSPLILRLVLLYLGFLVINVFGTLNNSKFESHSYIFSNSIFLVILFSFKNAYRHLDNCRNNL